MRPPNFISQAAQITQNTPTRGHLYMHTTSTSHAPPHTQHKGQEGACLRLLQGRELGQHRGAVYRRLKLGSTQLLQLGACSSSPSGTTSM